MITGVEVDISASRINNAGEMSWIKIIATSTEGPTNYYVYTDARGVHKGGCHPYCEEPTVGILDPKEIEITEDFAMRVAEILKINLEGRKLEEYDSKPSLRKFLPVGRR